MKKRSRRISADFSIDRFSKKTRMDSTPSALSLKSEATISDLNVVGLLHVFYYLVLDKLAAVEMFATDFDTMPVCISHVRNIRIHTRLLST